MLQCKETAKRLLSISRQQSIFTVNPVAEELGLVDAHGPGAVLALATNVPTHPPQEDSLKSHQHHGINGINGVVPGASPEIKQPPNGNTINDVDASDRPEAHFYGYMLDACEKLFEGELEQVVFEENMRFLFGTKVRIVLDMISYNFCLLLSLFVYIILLEIFCFPMFILPPIHAEPFSFFSRSPGTLICGAILGIPSMYWKGNKYLRCGLSESPTAICDTTVAPASLQSCHLFDSWLGLSGCDSPLSYFKILKSARLGTADTSVFFSIYADCSIWDNLSVFPLFPFPLSIWEILLTEGIWFLPCWNFYSFVASILKLVLGSLFS